METPSNPQPNRRPLIQRVPAGLMAIGIVSGLILLATSHGTETRRLKAEAQEQRSQDRAARIRASERAWSILMAGRIASCQLTRVINERRSPTPGEYSTDFDQTPRTVVRVAAQTTVVGAAQQAMTEASLHQPVEPPVLVMYPVRPHADPTANKSVPRHNPFRPDDPTPPYNATNIDGTFFPETSYPPGTELAVYVRTDAGSLSGQKFCGVARLAIGANGQRDFVIATPNNQYPDVLQEYSY